MCLEPQKQEKEEMFSSSLHGDFLEQKNPSWVKDVFTMLITAKLRV
jgi:hypothetical protein